MTGGKETFTAFDATIFPCWVSMCRFSTCINVYVSEVCTLGGLMTRMVT